MSEYINVTVPDGIFRAYVARPASLPAPAIVMVQEIFGINADLRATCDELAAAGFIAVSPDLFWRIEPGVDLNSWTPEEWAKGFELYGKFDFDEGVRDVLATLALARSLPGANGKAGVTGFCLGGLMTFLAAARGSVDAAVEYYGGGTDKYLHEANTITAPLLIHLAGDDEYIPKAAQAQIAQTLADHKNVTIETYPGCNHAFARHTGAHYDAAAAKLANGRTLEHFKKYLR